MNFNELFPDNNINETYPELQIGEDGYPKFNRDEVIADFNFDETYPAITSSILKPTASTDDESSNEEDKIVDVDGTIIGIDNDDSSNDEEKDTIEFVESSIFLSTTVVNTSTIKRTTITKTKTKTISYKTIYN